MRILMMLIITYYGANNRDNNDATKNDANNNASSQCGVKMETNNTSQETWTKYFQYFVSGSVGRLRNPQLLGDSFKATPRES